MKLKEQLEEMGLTEEQAQKIVDEVINGSYVPKSRFNEINEENKTLKQSLADRDKQLEDLQKSNSDNAALQEQITHLQQENADREKTHAEELSKLKLDNAIEMALAGAKARNGKAVKAMLDMEKVALDAEGKLIGFDEQIEGLKKSDGYLFDAQDEIARFTGFQPGAAADKPIMDASTYEARLADARKNNNQLDAIKIKQEAAAEGVILM